MSSLIATTAILPVLLAARLSSAGSSFTHGAHHVAHRLTSAGCPRKLASVAGAPPGAAKGMAGIASPLWLRSTPSLTGAVGKAAACATLLPALACSFLGL